MENPVKYTVSLNFEEIKLPPFEDILVLGKESPHGKNGISKSFEPLIPNGFEIVNVDHDNVDCFFVNKRIIAKMPVDKIIKILEKSVFNYVSQSEIVKVEFKVKVSFDTIEDDMP